MQFKNELVIIKGDIKDNIKSYLYRHDKHIWEISYYGNAKVYFYSRKDIEILKNPKRLNPSFYIISRNEEKFNNIDIIEFFTGKLDNYWQISYVDSYTRVYKESELKIVKSPLTKPNIEKVFSYLKEIAGINGLCDHLLSKRYEKIDVFNQNLSLFKYLDSDASISKYQLADLIFPFGCNASQYQATKNALENQLSVIQGPPGTGKTQTILNIIANLIVQRKTVQVVSNNNEAIKNIYEKLADSKYNLNFIVASLGSNKNKASFIKNQIGQYPKFSDWELDSNSDDLLRSIVNQEEQLVRIFSLQEDLALLKQELSCLNLELQHFEDYISSSDLDIFPLKKMSSRKLLELWRDCQFIYESRLKLNLFFKIKSFFRYGILDWNYYKKELPELTPNFQLSFYNRKRKELIARITEIETELAKDNGQKLLGKMEFQSMKYFKHKLAQKYKGNKQRVKFSEDDLWKHSDKVLREYPVVLSTTFSSKSSLQSKIVYDYLIIDEASQVDIATGALALSSAKNVIIVGDTKQLPNVIKSQTKERAEKIYKSSNVNKGYQYENSFLQSILDIHPDIPQTLLREHYRCHPKIINFCNQKFYNDELIIMTEDKGEDDVLTAIKTVKGNHARGHYNQRQIDIIKQLESENFVDTEQIGIIAPYKKQVDEINRQLDNIESKTVHKFQGREKDSIILSTVDNEITNFVDDPYLLNVAVSRAKKQFTLVVSGNEQSRERNISDLLSYIQYNNFEIEENKIYSVFDYLYKQYEEVRREYLNKHRKVSKYESENLMYSLIREILATEDYSDLEVTPHYQLREIIKDFTLLTKEESKYAGHGNTHVDFLIYNKISKTSVLAIEVDGYSYHQKESEQGKRDLLKNNILKKYRIPLLRFPTNGSGEKEKLIAKLEEIYN
ncbi:TPA: AAA domain-containing protein [Streptococcus mutans]